MTITNKKIVILFAIIAAISAGSLLTAIKAQAIEYPPNPTDITAIINNSGENTGTAIATVTNGSNRTVKVNFQAYKMFIERNEPGWLDAQVLFGTQTIELPKKQTIQMSVQVPNCKYQLDIYTGRTLSAPGGRDQDSILMAWHVSPKPVCVDTPTTLTCSPSNQNVDINQSANFSATGGNGTYNWSASIGSDHGNPASGTGTNFSTSYSTAGQKTVTVSSGSETVGCSVTVNNPPVTELSCAPQTQTINVGDIAVFSAQGGNGNYNWTSPGAPSTGVGVNFSSAFSSAGVKTVSVTDGAQTKQCSVTVNEVAQNLTCSPSSQTGNINDYLTFTAQGGSGSYNWSVYDGTPNIGAGSSFVTKFSTSGNKTITVISGSKTATCSASINTAVCVQPTAYVTAATNVTQNSATINAFVDPQGKTATYYFEYGVSQSYGYTTNSQTISSPQNVTFSVYGLQQNTTYYYRLVVQSECGNNQTQSMSFTTTGTYNPPQQQIYCNPQNQNVNVNDWVNFNATGGNGTYYWYTSGDASPMSGSGSSFGTRFSYNGTKIITVSSSNGGSAQCTVTVNTQQQYQNFQITKNVLNRTLGQTAYVPNVKAQAQDMVEFEIRVQTNGYNNYNNNNYNNNYYNNQVLVRDTLPYGLTYVSGSTRVNGSQVADGITQGSGIYLNNNYGNQEQVIRFLATVNQGQISGTLTNQVSATMNGDTRSAYASLNIDPRGTVLGAADIVTGPEDTLPVVLILGFLSALIAYYFMYHRKNASPKFNFASGITAELPIAEPKKKTEFEKMLERIRAEEKSPDA